ncbi:hypothetical protein BJY01DRAFT_7340 [Aspergillus pseudoustus]|uniref:Uncharacterized protein n=1 Tax=Aspergillus pseudoustus TaxID=1810923 RepID=A0ABR4JNW5_9EURO
MVESRHEKRADYTIARICALPVEWEAAVTMLDEMHDNEGPNWTTISLLVFAILIAIGAAVGIYAVITSDNNSAFALGAFLAAILTVYTSHQYFAWSEAV